MDTTLAAVRPYASPGHALVALPGPVSVSGARSDGLEGFARTFLAAGFRLAREFPGNGGLAHWYAEGVAAGTDPASPEAWPRLADVPQARVEAASVAIALHESRAVLWDALEDKVRAQVVDWLAEAVGRTDYPQCNWLWFQNVVEAFLRSVGGPWSSSDLERNIAATESWYRGDGWYTDGPGRHFDWYAGWAMNFYPLWYCRMSGAYVDESAWARYRERLRAYLDGVQHLYSPAGAPLHQGRSLTYRHAALAPVWAGAIFDATPLSPGRTRRLANGVLRYFGSAGGLQPIGWRGAFAAMRQPYSGAGSPYWSGKAFAGLVLAPEHPVWTDAEEPLEVEARDVHVTLPVPGWIVSGTRADGVVRVANHGTDGRYYPDDPGYARHAYSTHAGPDYDADARESPVDSHVALVDAHGLASHRCPLRPLRIEGRVGVSRHRARWVLGGLPRDFRWPPAAPSFREGPWLTTASVLRGAVEVRLVRVDTGGPWTLRIGGYPLACDDGPPTVSASDETPDGGAASTGTARRADGLVSTVAGLIGLPHASVPRREGVNAYGRWSATPIVESDGPVRAGALYAAAVVLGTGDVALPTITVEGDVAVVRWPDGATDTVDPHPVSP